uniref:phospholipase A2 n=1 Tax=Echinococcus granulosus TaxID=6210 RepID=A0A068WHM7_ECHGR|nr:calcium independent phospholipase A2 VIA [Echinococcus granulosus]
MILGVFEVVPRSEIMSRLGAYFTNFVKTALNTIHPNKVEEYPYEQYEAEYFICEHILELYHSFIFYKIANYYDMVYIPPAASSDTPSRERRVFSLFRFQGDVNDGIATFKHFAEVVHEMSKICGIYDVKVDKVWLEKVTAMCRRHPKWTFAHITACLNFPEALNHEKVTKWINTPDGDTGETPLHVALKVGGVETVQKILALKQTRLDICDAAGKTVLHVAVEENSLELLEILLDIEPPASDENASVTQPFSVCQTTGFKNSNRIDIDAVNALGETCLYLAVRDASEAIVATLLRAGANPRAGTTDYFPIHVAVEKDRPWRMNEDAGCSSCYLNGDFYRHTTMTGAFNCLELPGSLANSLNESCVDLLCNYYPDVVNLQSRDKKLSTLHIAKKKQMFNHLLELGADPNLQNVEGRTVLHQAVQEQDLDTVMQLLIHAAEVNVADNRGIYPLHLAAARCQDVHIVYALIVFEADPNITDAEGLSPRHWLCQHESNVDAILYALDVVQAQRCPLGRANCTSGCISPEAVSRRSQQADCVNQQESTCSRSSSYTYLTQLLQDMPFAALRSNTDPTGDLFNGTPPDPVLNNTNLTKDLDNDLFIYLSGGNHISLSSFSSSKSPSPQKRSSVRGICSTSAMQTVAEVSSDAEGNSPRPEPMQTEVVEGDRASPTATTQNPQSWFRRTIVSRFISAALPGLDSLFADEAVRPESVEMGPLPSPQQPPETEKEHVPVDEVDVDAKENGKQELAVASVEPLATGFATASALETIKPQELHHYYFENHNQQEQEQQEQGSHNHRHLWSRAIRSCSGRPGVPCCLERNARCFSAVHGSGGGINPSLPLTTFSTICQPTEDAASENMQRDAEGFRASRRGYRVLCLDGGGIRGLVLCQILRAIEKAAERPIRDLYDWVIGTSTGAMLALNIVQGKCVRYNRCLYFRLKEKIFVGNRPYPTEGFESLLREEFGERSVMSDIADVRVSVTALRGDHFPPRLHMFRNYPAPYERTERLVSELLEARSPRVAASTSSTSTSIDTSTVTQVTDNSMTADVSYKRLLNTFLRDLFGETIHEVGNGGEDESNLQESVVSLLSSFSRRYMYSFRGVEQPVPTSEQLVWQAARASGAAPSYFRACGPFLDGGLIANNPTLDLLTEAQELNIVRRLRREPAIPIACVTSLGTGRVPLREVQQLDVFRPQNMSEAYRVALGVTELSRMLVEMATMSEGRIVERSRAWCSSLGVPFFRFSPLLSGNVALDTKDTRTILQMLWETEAYLCNCRDRIFRLVDSLLLASDSPPASVNNVTATAHTTISSPT